MYCDDEDNDGRGLSTFGKPPPPLKQPPPTPVRRPIGPMAGRWFDKVIYEGFSRYSPTIHLFWKVIDRWVIDSEDDYRRNFIKIYKLNESLSEPDFEFKIREAVGNEKTGIVDCEWELILSKYENTEFGEQNLKYDLNVMFGNKCYE